MINTSNQIHGIHEGVANCILAPVFSILMSSSFCFSWIVGVVGRQLNRRFKNEILSAVEWKRFPNGMNKSLLVEKPRANLSAAVFGLCGRDTRVQFLRR